MNKNEVMSVIDSLACSQGYYGRLGNLIRKMEANNEDTSPFFAQFANCHDDIDVIMIIEN